MLIEIFVWVWSRMGLTTLVMGLNNWLYLNESMEWTDHWTHVALQSAISKKWIDELSWFLRADSYVPGLHCSCTCYSVVWTKIIIFHNLTILLLPNLSTAELVFGCKENKLSLPQTNNFEICPCMMSIFHWHYQV